MHICFVLQSLGREVKLFVLLDTSGACVEDGAEFKLKNTQDLMFGVFFLVCKDLDNRKHFV